MSDELEPGALDAFIAAESDEDKLALGLDRLEAALEEANELQLTGWAQNVYEYVHALRSGGGLNRPL